MTASAMDWHMLGVEVGRHLGDLQAALPLRAVCRGFAETVALAADAAELDMVPADTVRSCMAAAPPAPALAASAAGAAAAGASAGAIAECATLADGDAADAARRAAFFARCAFVQRLTYHVAPGVTPAKFEAVLAEASARLLRLDSLALVFNNGAQRLATRHLAALARALPRLRALSLAADFEAAPDCAFGALAPMARLEALRVAPGDACAGLTDGHVDAMAALPPSVAELEFPGHARGFTGASLRALAALPRLARLAILPAKPPAPGAAPAADYTLAHPAAAEAIAALCNRRGRAPAARRAGAGGAAAAAVAAPPPPPLDLDICVPDTAWVPALLAAGGAGLGRLAASVREAACGAQVAALAAAPRGPGALVGLDVAFSGAPEAADLAAIARLTHLERLTITSKCVRPPAARVDAAAALAPLAGLRSLRLHINPQWRQPLTPAAVSALAAALPRLERLHLRLGAADHAALGLGQLFRFASLRGLSLQWLGDDGPAVSPRAGPAARRASLEAPVLSLGSLPRGLEELSLTSITAVRLAPPAPYEPAFMAGPPLGALRALSLDGNFGLNDALLPAVAAAAPALRSLSLVLAGRQALTSAGLAAAAAALPDGRGLSSLHITDYREAPAALDQSALAGLPALLPRLRHLKLSTPDVVHAELQPGRYAGFAKLRRLDLVGCQDQAAAALAAALPLCCCKPAPGWAGEAGGGGGAEQGGAGA